MNELQLLLEGQKVKPKSKQRADYLQYLADYNPQTASTPPLPPPNITNPVYPGMSGFFKNIFGGN